MTKRQTVKSLLALASTAMAAPLVRAQTSNFPNKPIRIIVPFNAGSGSDSASRAYGEIMSRMLGQPVMVENRPGGSGVVAIQALKATPADGHTIFLGSTSPMCVMPVLSKNLPYDAFKDFRPVHGLSIGGACFLLKGDSPYKTLPEFLAAARRDKKIINVGNYSDGYMLVATWLGSVGGVQVNHVTYKGGVQLQTDLAAGQLDLGVNDISGIVALAKEGRIRPVAITSGERDPKFAEVLTMKELGFSDFETYVFASFFVRAETPEDITIKLANTVRAALLSPEGKAFQAANAGNPMMMHTKELGDFQRREYERFKKVADAAGIQPQ